MVKEIRHIIGDEKMLHVQTRAEKAEDMVAKAKLLQERLGGNFYVKIPISEEGLKATMLLKEADINVTVTAIFTPAQALLAAKAGADFVAPYVNRIDNISGDGVGVVTDIVREFSLHNLKTKVLAASFKNSEQVHRCALAGCHSITVTDETLQALISHPMTDNALMRFDNDWKAIYGEKRLADL